MSTAAFAQPSPGRVVVATTPSDSHSWNLVVLQLLLEEHGYTVRNLGPCTPVSELVSCHRTFAPDLVALSTVNGHGLIELPNVLPQLQGARIVIGGNLNTTGGASPAEARELIALGADRVFTEPESLSLFSEYLQELRRTDHGTRASAHRVLI